MLIKYLIYFLKEIKKRKQTSVIVTHNMELANKFMKIITIKNKKITVIKDV